MKCGSYWALACGAVLLLCFIGEAEPIPADAMQRPARPKTFDSPDDLRTYLNQLGQYYAVAGRPRFGKRTQNLQRLHMALDGLGSRLQLQDQPDLYDLLYSSTD